MALHNEGHRLEEDGDAALGGADTEGLQHHAEPRERGDPHTVEMQTSQAELAKPQELQASKDQAAQVSIALNSQSVPQGSTLGDAALPRASSRGAQQSRWRRVLRSPLELTPSFLYSSVITYIRTAVFPLSTPPSSSSHFSSVSP